MIVDEIAKKIFKIENDIVNAQSNFAYPKLIVFVSYDLFARMSAEISGQVSSIAIEFINKNTIANHKVYRVIDDFTGFKIVEV